MLLNDLWMILMTASAVAGLLAMVPVSTGRPENANHESGSIESTPRTTA